MLTDYTDAVLALRTEYPNMYPVKSVGGPKPSNKALAAYDAGFPMLGSLMRGQTGDLEDPQAGAARRGFEQALKGGWVALSGVVDMPFGDNPPEWSDVERIDGMLEEQDPDLRERLVRALPEIESLLSTGLDGEPREQDESEHHALLGMAVLVDWLDRNVPEDAGDIIVGSGLGGPANPFAVAESDLTTTHQQPLRDENPDSDEYEASLLSANEGGPSKAVRTTGTGHTPQATSNWSYIRELVGAVGSLQFEILEPGSLLVATVSLPDTDLDTVHRHGELLASAFGDGPQQLVIDGTRIKIACSVCR